MNDFKQFADAVNKRFLELADSGKLFKVNINRAELWDTYQSSYAPQDNQIFRERREHECNTCYGFIKRLGSVVAIKDGQLQTIWDVQGLSPKYQPVANAMNELVLTGGISSIFLSDEILAGKEFNIEANQAGDIRWDHFYADINSAFISQSVAADTGAIDTTVSVYKRALDEFSVETLESVIDLCGSIYRGTEFQPTVAKFLQAKKAYEQSNKALFIWQTYADYPAKIRNTAIGTLLINIQEGMELENAVKAFESVVAPANYKRTTAVVTEGMKQQALKTIQDNNLEDSLPRRHATLEDITINNVLFANRDSQAKMQGGIADLLASSTAPIKAPTSAQQISIEDFLETVMPDATNIEALVENKHTSNLVSLVAPINPEAPNMLRWHNNFSWSYNGEVADSMKERVKAAGGDTDGVLNFRLQWNEDKQDGRNDLDLHCQSPHSHIYYRRKGGECGGKLDVDVTGPSSDRRMKDEVAIENITWKNRSNMPNGEYLMYVNNFSGRNSKGFRAQVEMEGELFEYDYPQSVTSDVRVATVTLKDGKFSIEHHLKPTSAQKEEWDVKTMSYQKVSTVMLSPNYWDNNNSGNKHYFFMLEGCTNPSPVRGFYNEFLSEDLRPHRKTFEMLSSLMKCEPTPDQLSGLGFSSTLSNNLFVKVDNRPYNIQF